MSCGACAYETATPSALVAKTARAVPRLAGLSELPSKPVIVILLGGTTGVGQDLASRWRWRSRLGIGRVLSTDSIRQVMRIMLSNELDASDYTSSSFDAHRDASRPGAR